MNLCYTKLYHYWEVNTYEKVAAFQPTFAISVKRQIKVSTLFSLKNVNIRNEINLVFFTLPKTYLHVSTALFPSSWLNIIFPAISDIFKKLVSKGLFLYFNISKLFFCYTCRIGLLNKSNVNPFIWTLCVEYWNVWVIGQNFWEFFENRPKNEN